MRVAFFSFGACEGCRYRIVNEFKKVVSLMEKYGIEIVREPLLSIVSEDGYDIAVVEGAVTSKDIEKLKEIRKKAKFLIALGSCAYLGGISTLGYRYGVKVEEYVKKGYTLGEPLHKFVKVDSYVRGCPASVDNLMSVLEEIVRYNSAVRYERRFEYERTTDLNLDDGFLKLDAGKCIVCGRCIELCSKIGANVLTQAFRGYRVVVTTPAQIDFLDVGCIRCGLCAAYCPVAAITYRNDIGRAVEVAKKNGKVLIEYLALMLLAESLNLAPGQVIPLLRALGFSDVEVVDPLSQISNVEGKIVPYSSAEKRLVESMFPGAVKFLADYPKFKTDDNTVLVTTCIARKEDHTPTLTVSETIKIVKSMLITLEDISEEPLSFKAETSHEEIKVAKGPDEVKRLINEFVKKPEGTLVLQICPRGCERGSGIPFSLLNKY